MNTQSKEGEVHVKPQGGVILCQLPSGQCVTTTQSNCINSLGGMVVDYITIPTLWSDLLVLYTTPSGQEVVGTYEDCLADGGTLVEGFDSREKSPRTVSRRNCSSASYRTVLGPSRLTTNARGMVVL